MKTCKLLKSGVFYYTMVFQLLYALLIFVSVKSLKSAPPFWFRNLYILVGLVPVIIAFVFLIKDYKNPPKYSPIKKAYIIPFIFAFFDLLVLNAVILLGQTTSVFPVDYSRLSTMLLHNVIYFLAVGIILFLCIQLLESIKRRLSPKYYAAANIITIFIIMVSLVAGLMIIWTAIYGSFRPIGTTGRSRVTTPALYILGGGIVYFYINYLFEILTAKKRGR